ncbi:MAG: hypothetical protein FIA97_08960, partial [Methylococcaceae bacterium]|nr:hypothetical protein [Methylococcaceae bacterium]
MAGLSPRRRMNVGFSVLTSGSAVEIRCFGCDPSVADGMVSLFQCADGAAVLMGRLYYRADLIGALGDKATAEQHRSHAALAWAAYERWDHPGMARLEGDYCLVIWDRRRNRFIATRDPLGRFPLFWSKDSKAIAVSTSFAALPASGSRTLDLDYVADYLTRPLLGIQEPPSESCVWKQIRRVVPGEALIVDLNAGSALRRPYWNWLEQMVEPPSDRTEEIADDFAHRVRQAVMERSHGTTGAHLSGGVDSTAVAVLAQETLRSRPTPSSLHTFSLIYEHLATLCGETGYIDAALHVLPDAVAHRICADTLLTYDALRVEPDCDEPFADLLDLSRDQAILDAAASSGVTTLLTGHGGDDVFDVPPYHIADLLHSGAIRAAWREAGRWSNAFDGNSWRALYRYGLAPLMPVRLRAGLRAALAGGAVGWQQQGLGTLAPWLARPFAREYHLYERGLKQLRNVHASGLTVGLDFALAVLQAHVGNARGWALAIPRGVFLAHPLTDPRILGLGLGIRLRYRQAPGTHKPLLTLAMRDVLPAAIRQRHSKCHFNEVHYRGLAHNLANLEELIQTSRAGEMGLFDCGVLTECLRRASLGDDVSPQGALQLDLALSLIKWLALQERLAT